MLDTNSSIDYQMNKLLLHLRNHLPDQYRDHKHAVYVNALVTAFRQNYEAKNYQFAYLAFHMLMMIGVYVTLWQINRQLNQTNKMLSDKINQKPSPFEIAYEKEKDMLSLLKEIGCSDDDINQFKLCVDMRNHCAHANGKLCISSKVLLRKHCRASVRALTIIQRQSRETIKRLFVHFIETSIHEQSQSKKAYRTRITNDFIKKFYLSSYDVELLFRTEYVFPQPHQFHSKERRLRHALVRRYGDADPLFQGKLDRRYIAMMRNLDKLYTDANSEQSEDLFT